MSLTPKEMEAQLAEMRTKFAGKLAGRLAEVEAALIAAREGDDNSMGELRRLTHKLHGTAGSYGLHEVARTLAEMEAVVDAFAAGRETADPWDVLTQHLERAREAASRMA